MASFGAFQVRLDADGFPRVFGRSLPITLCPRPGEQYLLLDEIGCGNFGRVFRATTNWRPGEVAVKVAHPNGAAQVKKEWNLETYLRDMFASEEERNYVVSVLDMFEIEAGFDALAIVYPKMRYSTYDWVHLLRHDMALPISLIQQVGFGMLSGLDQLASVGVIHGDIKPENLLVSDEGRVMIADMGCAHQGGDGVVRYFCSLYYRAPEIVLKLPADCACDVWSAGLTLFEMLSGMHPLFPAGDGYELLEIIQEELDLQSADGTPFFYPLQMIGASPLRQGFDQRGRFRGRRELFPLVAFADPGHAFRKDCPSLYRWVMNFVPWEPERFAHDEEQLKREQLYDLLCQMLQVDPARRITAERALQHEFFAGVCNSVDDA